MKAFWLHLMLYLHILALAAYMGGAFVMEFVLTPAQAAIPPAQAQVMGEKTTGRYLVIAWSALWTIFFTCVIRLFITGHMTFSWPFFHEPLVLSSKYGRTTLVIFILWCLLVTNGSILTFKIRPVLAGKLKSDVSAGGVQKKQEDQMKAATWASRLVKIDLGIAVVAAILGVSIARAGGLF